MIQSYFQPGGGITLAVEAAIAAATATIRLAIYALYHPLIATALEVAARRGVNCQIVLDMQETRLNYAFLQPLAIAGITLRVWAGAGLMHDKFLIVDDALLIAGSYNYTIAAADNNAESAIATDDAPTIAAFLAEWTALNANAEDFAHVTPIQ
jgi:phosphatidylserine/phosphatidylglycerophosphate/cardiolipin synthase-like enzyme